MNPVGRPLLSVMMTGALDAEPFSPLRPYQTDDQSQLTTSLRVKPKRSKMFSQVVRVYFTRSHIKDILKTRLRHDISKNAQTFWHD